MSDDAVLSFTGSSVVFGNRALASGDASERSARDVLVVSPPNLAAAADARRAGSALLEGWPAATLDAVTVTTWSAPGLFSVRAPTEALRALYPSLRELGAEQVDAIGPDDMRTAIEAFPPPYRVSIDLPGSEVDALEVLDAASLLDLTETIAVRCGAEAFFEGGGAADDIKSYLEDRFFRLDDENRDDPDWPCLRFTSDPVSRRSAELERELAQMRAELEAVRSEQIERDAAAEAAAARIAELSEALEAQSRSHAAASEALRLKDAVLTEARAAIEASAREHAGRQAETAEAAAKAAELARALEVQGHALAETRRALEEKEALLAKAQAEVVEAARRIAAADAARDEASVRANTLSRAAEEREKAHAEWVETLEATQSGFEARVAELTTALSVKTDALAQAHAEARAAIDWRDQRLAESEAALRDATNIGEELKRTLAAKDAAIEEHKKAIDHKQKALVAAQAALEAAKQQVENLKALSRGKAQDLDSASETLDIIRAKSDALKRSYDELAADYEKLQSRNSDLEHRIHIARQEFHRSEGQLLLIKDLLLKEVDL